MIFSPEETLPRADLERLQLSRLQALVERLRARVTLYRERLAGAAMPRSLEDLAALPFTRKVDFRDTYPLGMLAVEPERLARIHASSGTTGNPTIGAYTRRDLDIWGEVCARSLAAGGMNPSEMFQVAWGYGLFTGGLGMHVGAERLGACVVPASSGNTARQMQLLEALPVVGIGCTPSYALLLAERFRTEQRKPQSLRVAICGAEAWTTEMRDALEAAFGVTATNIYGLTEIIGPGVAQECAAAKAGLHVFEDHFLPEIVDPEHGEPVPDGTLGELVLTTLTRDAMPVLRYRTGDLTRITREPCACGRTQARVEWFVGRVDDMLTIRGINVFPTAVEEVLLSFPELTPNYRIVVDRPPGGLDEMTVEVERAVNATIDETAVRDALARKLHQTLAVHAGVTILAPLTLERVEVGKAKRVLDRRAVAAR
ncbi:MAG: phenylacetate--CoA ligase [Candidatus Eremiobacteraeota bacterium]|nr:phenylacetate--CoA ligase [Candidatus Eremiobacteraeota bacterium]MBV8353710.1 phenylacetate--CoA ligase [Candidatus Eremiobacteraeota bacterium]